MVKEEVKQRRLIPSLSTIIITILMLIIPLVFFYLLSVKTAQLSPGENPSEFGLEEILFSIIFAFLSVSFLLWLKSFIKIKPYLGLIVGLVALGAFSYSVFFKFKGPYTTTFVILTGLIVLSYLGFCFFKYRNEEIS